MQNATPAADESREYVLTAKNTSAPTLYDARVIDCVPAGLDVTVLPDDATQAPVADGSDGCADGTKITWPVGTITTGTPKTLIYTVKVSDAAAGGKAYKNVATLTGSSLESGGNTSATEQVLKATDNKTLTVPSATVTKSIADSTLIVGETATYTVTGKLGSNVNYYDAMMTDALPDGLDPLTVSTTSVTCTYATDATPCALPAPGGGSALTTSGQNIGWFLGDLATDPKARDVKIVFTAKVVDNCTTVATASCNTIGKTRSNTVDLKWNYTSKPDAPAVDASFDKTVTSSPAVVFTVQEPVVGITKTVLASAPAPGDVFVYTVTASNPGDTNVSDAHNVVVEDVVPAGVVVDTDSISGDGTYDAEARTITWDIAVLTTSGPTSFKTFTYEASLAASTTLDGTARENTATVTGFDSLPTGGRHYTGLSASATVIPAPPHVTIAKRVVGSDVSYVDAPQNFEIVVTNDGASTAYDIDVTDVLPVNWAFGAATMTIGSATATPLTPDSDDANPETLTWSDLAPSGLAVDQKITLAYTATPDEAALDTPGAGSAKKHTNTASVTAEDSTGADHSGAGSYHSGPASAIARIDSADLSIDKAAVGTPVAGQSYSWTLTVHHESGDPAVGPIVVTDTIPADLTDVSADGTGWTCTASTDKISCETAGPPASGDLPAITVTGTIPSDLAGGTALSNSASVAARTYDPDDDNNSDEVSVDVTTLADLAVTKQLSGQLVAGENATYTLDVSNLGPSTSRGPITVKDTLPSGSTFVSAAGTGWDCEAAAGVLTCTRTADLGASAAAAQITVVMLVPASQTADVVNTAKVTATTDEPDTDAARENNTSAVTTGPTRTASLFVQKSLEGDDPLVAGDTGTYAITVRNDGPSTATQVTVTDTLPDYLTYVSGDGTDWSCTAPNQVVTCDLDGSLGVGAGQTTTVHLEVKVASGHTGEIVNEATATATEDPDGSTDDDTNTPDLRSDLEVEKTHTGDAVAGDPFTYDLKVTNHGPSDTVGPIVVTDSVPAGLTYTSVSGTGWACDPDEDAVTCTHLGGLVDDQSSTFSLTFAVAKDAGPAEVTNRVTVDGPNTDPDGDNNADQDPTTILDEANVRVTKTAEGATVAAGADATWTIGVSNDGPSDADDVNVTDTLPAGLTIVSIDGTGWTCTESPLACDRTTLAPGDAAPITVVTKVGSGVAPDTELENVAQVSTSTSGDDPDDNTGDDSITTTTSADLTLDKTHPGTPVAGEDVTFTLTAHNHGPSDAQGPIVITDELPDGMTYVSANDDWACDPDEQMVTCTLATGGPVVAGADASELKMRVHVASDQAGEELDNVASVASATPDPTDDNSDTDTVTPTGLSVLSITKTHTGPVRVGDDLDFSVVVHNDGPSEARQVKVDDVLPDGLVYVSADGDGWTCDDDEPSCTLDGPLAAGTDAAPITVTVTVTPDAFPGATNVAKVTSVTDNGTSAVIEDDDAVVVPPKVELSVVKELQGKARVGQDAVYTMTVHNGGPTADPGPITVTDQLPAGLTFVSGAADGWSCGEAAGLVTCTSDAGLAVDETEQVTLNLNVGAAAYPNITNAAQVTSEAEDLDPANNVSTVTDPVAGSSVLTIDTSRTYSKGTKAVWSIVVANTGPTETTAPITVTDKLPSGLEYVSADGAGWVCKVPGRTITCVFDGLLALGETASIRVVTTITADDGSEIVNEASAVGGNATGGGAIDPVVDDATVTAPSSHGLGALLPNTGGPVWWLLLAGLGCLGGGALVLTRRRPVRGKHV